MSLICKRFEKGEKPYSAEEISLEYKIPIKLTHQILSLLQEINLIHGNMIQHQINGHRKLISQVRADIMHYHSQLGIMVM